MYDLINFKRNGLILQGLALLVLILNVICSLLRPTEPAYTYLPSTPPVPELPERRDSGQSPPPPDHSLSRSHSPVFPELPADVIRTRPQEAVRRTSMRHRLYSTSASTFETNTIVF